MQLSCFDQSGGIFASTMFLNITVIFVILAALAVVRLIAMSGEGSIEQLQAV